ncbi:endonuclease domain-containing protein [Bradyrhizobium sp. STM 3557]|uniref:endonuclease domain-containing protein n=1 Tax=Bradyrhizobium sp. STM 3557 TaxID=578920 RepID=UPI00388F86B2
MRTNQTDAETALWNRIRNRQLDGYKFVRQEPLKGYICDFVCRERGGWSSKSMVDSTMNPRKTSSEIVA